MTGAGLEAKDCLCIHYKFTLMQNRTREFHIRLRRDTLSIVGEARDDYPEWTLLTYEQCSNCPLRPDIHEHCPVAVNLVDVVEYFKDVWSCEEADVEITTENRACTKHTQLQDALSGLAGIYMVTSGCPILDKLRPMVYLHAPFGNLQETMYRSVSMYCLAQFFRKQHGKEPDWELTGLANIYEAVSVVNRSFHRRILNVTTKEAGRNALIRLDCYAQYTNNLVLQKALGGIEQFFDAYLNT